MPRYANLKGSMNPFDNNKPVLSSSERLKNKRDKAIYNGAKQRFQAKKTCGNKNMKFYDNGTLRSTISYKMNMKLSRGAVLCQDCKGNGTLCENIFDKNDLTKITMGNNSISTLNLGSGLIGGGGCEGENKNENIIITSDISGVWGGSTTDISKSLIGPGGALPLPGGAPIPYGYVSNLINVPRNLDGNGVVIDPSNVLFPIFDGCNSRLIPKPNYMNIASIKTFIIYEGPMSLGNGFMIDDPTQAINNTPGSPNYFMNIINNYCTFNFSSVQPSVTDPAPTGQIGRICPIGKRLMNNTSVGPPPGGSIFEVDIFKVYIEITNFQSGNLWQGSIYPSPDKTNFIPQFRPNTISNFTLNGYDNTTVIATVSFTIDFRWASNFDPVGIPIPNNGGGIGMSITIDQNNIDNCDLSQIRSNNTKQSYMSCLGDKTKQINLTTTTPIT